MREFIFLLTLPIATVHILSFTCGYLLHFWTPIIPTLITEMGLEVIPILGVYLTLFAIGSLITFKSDQNLVE